MDQEAFPTKVSPHNIPTQNQRQFAGVGPLIQLLVVLLLATEGRSVIRSYDLWKKKDKIRSPQLFQDSECWPSWELNGALGSEVCTRPFKLYSFQY